MCFFCLELFCPSVHWSDWIFKWIIHEVTQIWHFLWTSYFVAAIAKQCCCLYILSFLRHTPCVINNELQRALLWLFCDWIFAMLNLCDKVMMFIVSSSSRKYLVAICIFSVCLQHDLLSDLLPVVHIATHTSVSVLNYKTTYAWCFPWRYCK